MIRNVFLFFSKNTKISESNEISSEEKIDFFWEELYAQCIELGSETFDAYWEMWGMDTLWFIEVNNQWLSFTYQNEIETASVLQHFEQEKRIEKIKTYTQEEMNVEHDRIQYKIIKK